ncbi:MAG: isoleucine--tRNA ligase [bacterium]
MNYTPTLNLPKTKFQMKAQLSKNEPEIFKMWEEWVLYQKIKEKSKEKPKFILHDGPPYPNGDIHLGTAFNKCLKDLIIKFKTMSGYNTCYVPGWDCHGMPIENIILKQLGEEKYKLSRIEIRNKCKDYALKYVDTQRTQFKRLGVLGEWDNPYLTLSYHYEAKILEIFKELVEKGYIFKGLRPIHWCATCETALAEAEVEHSDHISPSIYVKFKVIDGKNLIPIENTYIIIWTTTPWTLFGNVAVALHPDFEYVVLKIGEEKWILSKNLVELFLSKMNLPRINGDGSSLQGKYIINSANSSLSQETEDSWHSQIKNSKPIEILKTIKGKDLEHVVCQHPLVDRTSSVILANFITNEVGTGCVHIAPGHGQEDYAASLKYNLPIIVPVDSKGKFTNEVKDFQGMFVFKTNVLIIEKLKQLNILLFTENISHSYPYCWRCHNPIIFRATSQWFMNLNHNNLKEKAIEAIHQSKWIPAWGEEKIVNMVKTRPDYCLSRQRIWGTPIPVFHCKNCEKELINIEAINKTIEKTKKQGIEFWFQENTSYLLPSNITCSSCGEKEFIQDLDIVDVWFESGVSWAAVLEENDQLTFPADIYLEATDQHRGWFQSSLLPSVASRNKAPYKMVITHGLILDEKGKKMSKSRGNVVNPLEIIEKHGADVLRLYFFSVDFTTDICISEKNLQSIIEIYRKIRNTCRYILGNLYDFNPETDSIPFQEMKEIDKFALMELQELIKKTTSSYENYEFHKVMYFIKNYCILDLSSFYLDVLKDRLYVSIANSQERKSAQTVLYKIISTLAKLIAPLLPYTAEEVWQYIFKKKDDPISIHLTEWPKIKQEIMDKNLQEKWVHLLKIREKILKSLEISRENKQIGQSLEAKIILYPKNDEIKNFLKENEQILEDISIVSEFQVSEIKEIEQEDFEIKVEKALGEKCNRCWMYKKSVGEDLKYNDVCQRCGNILNNLSILEEKNI